MNTSCSVTKCLVAWLAVLALSPASYAEIYKWVDANGRTHYSERKDGADQAKKVVTHAAPQSAGSTATSPSEYWQDQERRFRQRQIGKSGEEKRGDTAGTRKPKSLSGGREDGSDASRCNLARDVISGAVKHRNGKPTDQYDIEIAESDIRLFCR